MLDDRSYNSKEDIEALVTARVPESDTLEFKQAIENRQMARVLAAMANHRGGYIILGIAEDNSRASGIAPIALDGASEAIANIARDAIDEPIILAELTPIYFEGQSGVLIVRVDMSSRAPHFVQGQGLTRSGPTTRPMTAHEIGSLFARRGSSFADEFQLNAAKPADVVARLESERRQKGIDNKGRIKESTSHRLVLMNRGDEDAFNVKCRLLTPEGEEARNPIIDGDYPIEILRAGTEVSFVAVVSFGGDRPSVAEISWEDRRGKRSVRQSISI